MQLENNGGDGGDQSLEKRPGIIFVGSPNVGKRTLLSRLISVDFDDTEESPEEVLHRSWTINTKYYTADVSISVAHIHEGFSITTLPAYTELAALVMVFDMNDLSSLVALQNWVSRNNLQRFEILLCIGNKVDLIPDHPVHSEYRRRLLKIESSSVNSDSDYADFGISETEGSSLLGDDVEGPSLIRRSCLEWCGDHNIEFIEACAANPNFDKCLSTDGDLQGVERLLGALSANMWPGMILKSGGKITVPSLPEREDLSEEEDSDFELEYERLSDTSAEPWDDSDNAWVSANSNIASSSGEASKSRDTPNPNGELENGTEVSAPESGEGVTRHLEEPDKAGNTSESLHFDFDELEQLMSGIGNVRENLRLMPDSQRREMAAKMALKMAAMFGGTSDDEDEH